MSDIIEIITAGARNGLLWSMLILGVYISFRILDTADLSIEGTFPLGASVAAIFIWLGANPLVATLMAIIAGFGGGIITGVLHTKLHIPAILAGIITMTALITVNMLILGLSTQGTLGLGSLAIQGRTVFSLPMDIFSKWMSKAVASDVAQILVAGLFCAGCYILIYYLFGTEFGMALRATGNNKTMARAQGINTDLMIIIGLAISNALIALSGALFAQAELTADCNSGKGAIVNGLTAIIIGELIFGRKTFKLSLVSCLVGSFLYFTLKYIVVCLGLVSLLYLVQAVLITVLMAVPMIKRKKAVRRDARD